MAKVAQKGAFLAATLVFALSFFVGAPLAQTAPAPKVLASLTLSKDISSPTGIVFVGTENALIGKFLVQATRKDFELRKMTLAMVNSGGGNYSGNFVIIVDGAVVYSGLTADLSKNSVAPTTLSLSSFPTIKAGVNSYVAVYADIVQTVNSYQAYLDINEARILPAKKTIDPAVLQVSGNVLTLRASILDIVNLATPLVQTVVAGTNNFEFLKVQLNSGASGDDIKVSGITIYDILSDSATYSDIRNLTLYKDGQPIATLANNSAINIFTFTTPVIVPVGLVPVFSLRGDLVSGAIGTHRFTISGSPQVTAVGTVSGLAAIIYSTETHGGECVLGVLPLNCQPVGTGQTTAIATPGTLTLSLVSGVNGSPSLDQVVNIGTTNIPIFTFKLTATNEAQKIRNLKLTATGASLNQNDVINMRLFRNNETQPFATGNQMSCSNNVCVFTWTATDNLLPDAIQPGAPVTIYVKADIGPAGVARLGDSFKFSIASSADVTSVGAYSGMTATVSGSPMAGGTTNIVPFNVNVTGDAPSAGSAYQQAVMNGTQIGRFKITNNGSGQIELYKLYLTDMGIHTGTTTTFKLTYSDENSTNYMANVAVTSQADLLFSNFGSPLLINGGSYRYVTVSIANIGGAVAGDAFNLSVKALSDVKYSVTEANLGYDNNYDGDVADTVNALYADGKPTLGVIIKQ